MFIVGNTQIHAQYLKDLARPHALNSSVGVYYAGEKIGELDFETGLEDGTVTATARNRERRTLTLYAREGLWPKLPNDPLSPYGIWLQANTTVVCGTTRYGPIPVFAGKLNRVRRRRRTGVIEVRAVDPFWQINKEPIEAPRQAPTIPTPLATLLLLREVFPNASLTDQTALSVTIADGTVWNAGDGSRGRVLDEVAAAVGAELFALPTQVWPGGEFVLRPVPGLDGAVDWHVTGTVIEADEQELSNDEVVNRWIVTVERPDSTTLFVPSTDNDPGSPTRYGGPLGKLARHFSSPLVQTEGQAIVAGQAKLNRTRGMARTRRLAIIANPALECGDLLAVSVDGEPEENNIVDGFELSLTASAAAMTADCRGSASDDQ